MEQNNTNILKEKNDSVENMRENWEKSEEI